MSKIGVFCEDSGHEIVISGLLSRIIENKLEIIILSATHGKGRALSELEKYLRQVEKGDVEKYDAIVIAIDANCKGYNEKKKEIESRIPKGFNQILPIVFAIPDPHVEKWMLLDSSAFKNVFGKGCDTPAQKCEKDRYKKILNNEITKAGGTITISWLEHAEELIGNLDIDSICKLDDSVKKFVKEVRNLRTRLKL